MKLLQRIFCLALVSGTSTIPALGLDLVRLFRADVVDAHIRIGWRGDKLSEETRLAVAATGLCWDSSYRGRPLFVLDAKRRHSVYAPASERAASFAALPHGEPRLAVAYALSLALEPPERDLATWQAALDFLARDPAGLDRVILGILLAPKDLKPLARLQYAAADVLAHRASVATLPALLTLADSSDRYLRSRAIIGLGVVAYRDERLRPLPGLLIRPEESSISAVQRQRIRDVVRQGATDKNYRTRFGAALALGLMGEDSSRADLERLARDPAYLLLPEADTKRVRVVYPVRMAACAALTRFGITADPGGGTYDRKSLRAVTRGGTDKSNDYSDIRRDIRSSVPLFAWE